MKKTTYCKIQASGGLMGLPLMVFLSASVLSWFSLLQGATAPVSNINLVRNPDFSLGAKYWQPKPGGQGVSCAIANEPRGESTSCAGIAAAKAGHGQWSHELLVTPYAQYRLTGWLKVKSVAGGEGAGAFVQVVGARATESRRFAGTSDWQTVTMTFASENCTQMVLSCMLGDARAPTSGQVYFDDIKVTLISSPDPAVAISLNRGFSFINPNIYGQFIEHMGNSIYGGLWAEMLEDRKFFFPVALRSQSTNGEPGSPWRKASLGTGASVGMDTQHPYVGRWSVELSVKYGDKGAAGIRHGRLGLCRGRRYTGYVVAQQVSDEAAALEVMLGWGGQPEAQVKRSLPLTSVWTRHAFSFQAGGDGDDGFLQLSLSAGTVRIGAVSLMPADHVEGFRADTLDLLKTLGAPVYRWPGGNFVSAYNWWEAIGDRDKRPPFKNPSWPGIEHNDVGIDEFIRLCRLIGSEPYVVVNAGLGSPRMAAALVAYCNASPETEWGEKRAENGHAKPYAVQWWGIGNEMYGDWQHGAVPLTAYTKRHNIFADAMLKVDSTIQVIAVGDSGPWSRAMLESCRDRMHLLSEHFYAPTDLKDVFRHVNNMRHAVRDKAVRHLAACEKVFGVNRASVPVALDEWNYAWGKQPHIYGDYGLQYGWRDGLGVAAGLCEMIRWRRVFAMANWAQTVNVLGAVKTNRTDAALSASGLPLLLFGRQFGRLGLAQQGWTSPLTVAAGLTPDRKVMTLAVVNPTEDWQRLAVDIQGGEATGRGELWQVAHPDPHGGNRPGGMPPADAWPDIRGANPAVRLAALPWLGVDLKALPAAPYSLSLWRLDLARDARVVVPKPVDSLAPPPSDGRLVMVFARQNALYGATSLDGLVWRPMDGQAPLLKLPEGAGVKSVSLCRGPDGFVLVLERAGKLWTCGSKDLKSFSGFRALDVNDADGDKVAGRTFFDPCLFYRAEDKQYQLLVGMRTAGAYAAIQRVASADLAGFSRPEPVLALGYHVRGGSLLRGRPGRKNFFFFYDDRLGTACMAMAGRPEGPFVTASPPIGSIGTARPRAFFNGREVVLFLSRREGGFQVLKSPDLRGWEAVPSDKYQLPGRNVDCFDALWVDAETAAPLNGEAR